MNDGWIPFVCSGSRVQLLCMTDLTDTQSRLTVTLELNRAILNLISTTCAFFPTVTCQNVCSENGLSPQFLLTCYISFSPT